MQNTSKINFSDFEKIIEDNVLNHPIIKQNNYTQWFAAGDFCREELVDFIKQFSVFSNQFVIAQMNKAINAPSLEHMRASKEIVANEIGVIFKRKKEEHGDLVNGLGMTVDGGTFKFKAAHFEWLLDTAKSVGLDFDEIGKRKHGNRNTLDFCDDLIDLYGGDDYQVAQACSFAIENWANKGFWKELISGFQKFNSANQTSIPIGFFTWHDEIEEHHASHTQEELRDLFNEIDIDVDVFVSSANKILDSLAGFWGGIKRLN